MPALNRIVKLMNQQMRPIATHTINKNDQQDTLLLHAVCLLMYTL